MSFAKENFLRTRFVSHLQQLHPSTPPRWGKMSVQQMIEHYTVDSLQISSGKRPVEKFVTPAEHLTRAKEFLMSEKPFRENTKNPLLGEEPLPLRYKTMQAAIGNLQEELIYFFEVFDKTPGLITRNPIFGDLNFDENVQFLYKHALYHLRQFGVTPLIF